MFRRDGVMIGRGALGQPWLFTGSGIFATPPISRNTTIEVAFTPYSLALPFNT